MPLATRARAANAIVHVPCTMIVGKPIERATASSSVYASQSSAAAAKRRVWSGSSGSVSRSSRALRAAAAGRGRGVGARGRGDAAAADEAREVLLVEQRAGGAARLDVHDGRHARRALSHADHPGAVTCTAMPGHERLVDDAGRARRGTRTRA